MYPWNSNCNHNLTSFPGQVNIQHRPSLFNNDMNNPNFSKVFDDLPPPSSAHFPSPYIPCEEAVNDLIWHQLCDLSYPQQQQQQQTLTTTAETAVIVSNMADLKKDDPVNNGGGKNTTPQITTTTTTRKRSSKKDRHSKINTAHGPRDRRMRLSLEVARKFFDLQDMLGFDKASKTVDWLLIQSSLAIKEIMGSAGGNMPGMSNNGANSVSSTSEGEGVSGIDDSTTTTENQQQQGSVSTKAAAVNTKQSKCNKEQKVARRSAFHRFARESRKIARERARKRTMEKKIRQGQVQATTTTTMDNINNNNNLNRLGSSCWTQFDQATEESGNQGPKISSHSSYELGQTTEVEEVLSSRDQHLLESIEYAADDSLVITGNWNTSTICNFHQNAEISHQHHFSEFDQYCSKPWEACNNI